MGERTCTVPDCGHKHVSLGWCVKHYNRIRRTGTTEGIERPPRRMPICRVEDCSSKVYSADLCGEHFRRWRTTGSLAVVPAWRTPPLDRFWPKVDATSDCWLWTGHRDDDGYGKFTVVSGQSPMYAHRWSYEFLVGPIPAGLVLDHLCRNPPCTNPDHLEPVTNEENIRRGIRHRRR